MMSSTGVSALELELGEQLVQPRAPTCEAQGGQGRWESEMGWGESGALARRGRGLLQDPREDLSRCPLWSLPEF